MLPVSRCAACGETAFPPRDQCARCSAPSPDTGSSDGRGRVVASTWVPTAFGIPGFGADGFGVAWVDLDDGPRVQVLVADGAPGPDTRGTVDLQVLEGVDLPVFAPEAS
jgi:uncharacterized OB-fold protein